MTPTDLAYLAGFLDGEGCFLSDRGSVRVVVANTYRPVLEQFQAVWGGFIERQKAYSYKHRQGFRWVVKQNAAIRVVQAVLPFLREKRPQAELLLELPRYPRRSARSEAIGRELSRLKRIEHE